MFALDQGQKFPCAGTQLLLVLIRRPCHTVRSENMLHHDRIDRQQHWTSLWQAYQHRLMPGCMTTGLKQGQARQQFAISIKHAITQCRMIPMSACGGETWMAATCQIIMCTLNDKFRIWKCIMISRVIYVEVGTDENIDIVGAQTKIGEMLNHVFLLPGWRRPCRYWNIRRESAINQNMSAIVRLD